MRGRKTATGLVAIAVGGAIVLGGCGGGSGNTTETSVHQAMHGNDHQAMHGSQGMHEKGAGHGDAMHEG